MRDSEPEPEAKHVVKLKTINSRSNLTIQLPKSEAENSSESDQYYDMHTPIIFKLYILLFRYKSDMLDLTFPE